MGRCSFRSFGTHKNFRTEHIAFDIAPINLPYNAILGFPALAKFMAVVHHAYNIVKLPGITDIITIRYAGKDAINSLMRMREAAASARPAPEDVVEPAGLPSARKKPIFS